MRTTSNRTHPTVPGWLYQDAGQRWGVIEGDALDVLPLLPDASVDVVVTDPPYGIGFRGETWDGAGVHASSGRPGEAFSLWTARWAAECRRILKPGGHLIAFGAPRTFHRLSVGIEDAGLELRDVLLSLNAQGLPKSQRFPGGLGSALKPAWEPAVLARAPLAGTLRSNHATWGTGLLAIDDSRVDSRWPAHLLLSHSPTCADDTCADDCPAALLDAAAPATRPSRFFFAAKATRAEREAGCDELPAQRMQIFGGARNASRHLRRNIHPTVKPLSLMTWLIRLTCPDGGIVLDAFAGSGSTGAAAVLAGRQFLGIEREGAYVDIACARISHWARTPRERP